jgi:hypothetical protein
MCLQCGLCSSSSFPHHCSPSGVFVLCVLLARRLRVCSSSILRSRLRSCSFVSHRSHFVSHHSPSEVFVLRVLFPIVVTFWSLRSSCMCFQCCLRSPVRFPSSFSVLRVASQASSFMCFQCCLHIPVSFPTSSYFWSLRSSCCMLLLSQASSYVLPVLSSQFHFRFPSPAFVSHHCSPSGVSSFVFLAGRLRVCVSSVAFAVPVSFPSSSPSGVLVLRVAGMCFQCCLPIIRISFPSSFSFCTLRSSC